MAFDGFDYNKPPDLERERLGIAVWEQQFPKIDELTTKLQGPFMTVDPRSSLQLDDRYLGRWRAGGLQGSAMAAALDALLTTRMVLQAGTLPMTGLYPVLRAAIENASLAIYLLGPKNRDERLARAYGVAAAEADFRCKFLRSIGQDGTAARTRIFAEIRVLVKTRPSFGDPRVFRPRNAQHTEIVTLADAELRADPASTSGPRMPLIAIWQLLSGLSHAKQWALVEALHRTEAVVNAHEDTALVKMTSGTQLVGVVLFRAVEALEVALRLHGRRSTVWTSEPEDATEPRASQS